MGGLSVEAASKRVTIDLFFSISQAPRETLLEKLPGTQIATITPPVLLDQCGQTFVVKRIKTLEKIRFFSCRQETKESLHNFWNAFNGFAVQCEFEGQTNSLVYAIFFLSMNNQAVLERLCTEPKGTPEEAFQLAVANEKGLKGQTSYGDCELEVKSEPICVCSETKVGTSCT